MHRFIISLILLAGLFSALPARAADVELKENAPERYTVVQGDTLWGLASRYLKNPWLWPQIWGLNKDQIKSPHKIYPGDTIILEKLADGSQLMKLSRADTAPKGLAGESSGEVVRLSPRVRTKESGLSAIPGIPASAIEPFLSQPLIVEEDYLEKAPVVLGSNSSRVIMSKNDTIYARDLPADKGSVWQLFRTGKVLKDLEANEILGYEAVYLGDARVEKSDKISTLTISRSVEEILKGDRLVPAPEATFDNYAPHAPDKLVRGHIVSVYGGVTEVGRGSIISINKGMRDGLEMGHVLAVYRKNQTVYPGRQVVDLPDERIGLLFVFRVFEKVSYALIVQSSSAIQVSDIVQTP